MTVYSEVLIVEFCNQRSLWRWESENVSQTVLEKKGEISTDSYLLRISSIRKNLISNSILDKLSWGRLFTPYLTVAWNEVRKPERTNCWHFRGEDVSNSFWASVAPHSPFWASPALHSPFWASEAPHSRFWASPALHSPFKDSFCRSNHCIQEKSQQGIQGFPKVLSFSFMSHWLVLLAEK